MNERIAPEQWPDGYRQCTKCLKMKNLTEFSASKKGKFGRREHCKVCIALSREANKEAEAARKKRWVEANREHVRAHHKKKYAANRETIKARSKAWYIANPERVRATKKAYGIKNREAKAIYDRVRRVTHKDVIIASQKAWRERNQEHVQTQHKAHWEANKEKYNARRKSYYAANKPAKAAYDRHYLEVNRERIQIQTRAYLKTPAGRASKKAIGHRYRTRGQYAFDTLVSQKDLMHWEKEGAICYLTGKALLPGEVTWDHVVPLHFGGTNDVWNFLPTSQSTNSGKRNKIVYFDIATREARYTLDPCPGGPTWPRIPLQQPTHAEMEVMISASKARKEKI